VLSHELADRALHPDIEAARVLVGQWRAPSSIDARARGR
jgi:hypothetical protein